MMKSGAKQGTEHKSLKFLAGTLSPDHLNGQSHLWKHLAGLQVERLRFLLAWACMEAPAIPFWMNLLQQDGMPLHHSPKTFCKTLRKRTWCKARDRQANCGQLRNLQHKQHHAAPDPKLNSSRYLQRTLNTLVQVITQHQRYLWEICFWVW